MEIGNRINQLRKLSGMTQEQLAEKLHVSRQTISKWEAGVTMPDLESVVLLSLHPQHDDAADGRTAFSDGVHPVGGFYHGAPAYYAQYPVHAVPLYRCGRIRQHSCKLSDASSACHRERNHRAGAVRLLFRKKQKKL